MINKLKSNKLGALTSNKVTPDKVNEIIDTINSGITQIGKLIGFDMNSTNDQLIKLVGGTSFIITDVIITNPSTSLSTAEDIQFWTGVGRTGVGNQAQANNTIGTLALLVGNSNFINHPSGQITIKRANICNNTLYASLGTPQGVPATADIYVYGYTLK